MREIETIESQWGIGLSFGRKKRITREIEGCPQQPAQIAHTQAKALSAPQGKTLGFLKCPYCGHRHNPLDLVNDDGVIANGDVDCQKCNRSMAMDCRMEYVFNARPIR